MCCFHFERTMIGFVILHYLIFGLLLIIKVAKVLRRFIMLTSRISQKRLGAFTVNFFS